jgi:hypothetical protein
MSSSSSSGSSGRVSLAVLLCQGAGSSSKLDQREGPAMMLMYMLLTVMVAAPRCTQHQKVKTWT